MVPMVNAAEISVSADVTTAVEESSVSSDVALQSANAAIKEFVSRNALNNTWKGATANSDPEVIFDMNGEKLFYLFSVENNGKRIGEIKIAASKVVGASIVTIGPGAKPIDLNEIRTKANEIVNQKYNNATINSIDLVCYDYPDIGGLVKFTVSGTENHSFVIDAYDLSLIPSSDQISFYNSIPSSEILNRTHQWDSDQKYLQTVTAQSITPMATVTKTINGFSLYPQQGTNWCAFATAQMISAYYGYQRTQQTIANTIGVNPDNGASIELVRSNYYIVPVASGGLGKAGSSISYTGMFTYNDIMNEMNSNRPIHTDRFEASSYHARAITGYSYTTTAPVSQYLYIYDPWPTTSGAVYWENWNVFTGQPNPVHAILYIRN